MINWQIVNSKMNINICPSLNKYSEYDSLNQCREGIPDSLYYNDWPEFQNAFEVDPTDEWNAQGVRMKCSQQSSHVTCPKCPSGYIELGYTEPTISWMSQSQRWHRLCMRDWGRALKNDLYIDGFKGKRAAKQSYTTPYMLFMQGRDWDDELESELEKAIVDGEGFGSHMYCKDPLQTTLQTTLQTNGMKFLWIAIAIALLILLVYFILPH